MLTVLLTDRVLSTVLLGGIASYACLRSVVCLSVCLSVVCHIRVSSLNRWTDLDAIRQVHMWGPMTRCVTPREREIEDQTPAIACNCTLLLPPGE